MTFLDAGHLETPAALDPYRNEALGLAISALLQLAAPIGRVLKPQSVNRITGLADDFTAIYRAGGVPAMKESLALADSTADARRLAATSAKYRKGYRGTLKLLGAGVIRLADLLLEIGGWLLFAVLWIFGVIWFVTRQSAKLIWRLIKPRPRRRFAPAT